MAYLNSIETLTADVEDLSICSSPNGHPDIDQELYSRQLYVLGEDAMRKMAASNILIVGLGGVGVEVAKNIILGGVRSVTLHDEKNTQISDLGSNFYLSSEHLGQNRAAKCRDQLARLNSNVRVEASNSHLTLDFIRKFSVVVLTEGFQSLKDVDKISGFCHENDIKFILCEGRGLFARVFCDFGDDFVINDPIGSNIMPITVKSSRKVTDGVSVSCTESHGLFPGDTVKFWRENGKVSVLSITSQEGKLRTVSGISGHNQFSVSATNAEDIQEILESQFVMKVNVPYSVSFEPLMSALEKPKYIIPDEVRGSNHSVKIHNLFRSLDIFASSHDDELPSKEDLEEMLQILKRVTKPGDQVDEKLAEAFIRGCRASICPIDAIVGGWVGQEVMKACSGKFKPLNQWLFLDAAECIPENVDFEGSEDIRTRYSGQVSIFGSSFQKKLANLRYFVVGCGAIGCEILKNFAMMGVGTGPEGAVIITDMDIIEKSNLNRQFLFRHENVRAFKSTTAGNAIKIMNPDVNVDARVSKVGEETEATFNSNFWNSLDGVANALDNVAAREYMNDQCVRYLKPLLESGTHGAKGQTEVIIPNESACYKAPRSNSSKEIPLCTLKFFPSTISHTIPWARELFEQLFSVPVKLINQFLRDELKSVREVSLPGYNSQLEHIQHFLELRPENFEDCITWACCQFETLFRYEILDLIDLFPKDKLDDRGVPFWSDGKKFPSPISINDTAVSADFVKSTAILRAKVFGISAPNMEHFSLQSALKSIQVQRLSKKINLETVLQSAREENDSTYSEGVSSNAIANALHGLPNVSALQELSLQELEFEKDDNLHMSFITSASNVRAANYGIPTASNLETKLIAGRIIPAIATTTSVVAGLVALEVLKFAAQRPLAAFKNCSVGLGAPTICFSRPPKPRKYTCNGRIFNEWDRIEVKEGSLTVQEFLTYLRKEFDWELSGILWKQQHIVYSPGVTPEEELGSKIEKVVENLAMEGSVQLSRLFRENKADGEPQTIIFTVTGQNSINEGDRFPPVYYCYD